jgi:hypothetical protein
MPLADESKHCGCTLHELSTNKPSPSAAALSESGSELWAVTESNESGGISISGYAATRCPSGGAPQWRLQHSFAGIANMPHEAVASPITVHLLPMARALTLVTCGGLVLLISITEPSCPPQKLHLVRPGASSGHTFHLTWPCMACSAEMRPKLPFVSCMHEFCMQVLRTQARKICV